MLWEKCLERLKEVYSDNNLFAMWIKPLKAQEEAGRLKICAANMHWCNKVKAEYYDAIAAAVEQVSEGRIMPDQIDIVVDSLPGNSVLSAEEKEQQPATTLGALETDKSTQNTQSSKKTKKPNAAKNTNSVPNQRELDENFTFSLFVEGVSNRLAAQTCRDVLIKLGHAQHNPLVLYGATGLGKTHLMQAVGNALLKSRPQASVAFITAEDFVRGYSIAVQNQQMEEFKEAYRSLDLLMIDDIHLLRGEKSMLEFFYTLNHLLDQARQVIFTSDRYPKELTSLDDRLISRLSWGLAVEIEPPDLDTRINILQHKAENRGVDLPRNCALFIAQQVVANVRELEGALNKVIALSEFRLQAIDMDMVREALKHLISLRTKAMSAENIQKVVGEYFRISVKDLTGKSRARNLARPRQIAMALTRELTGDSYPDIGKAFGGRDHSTVMHACEKVNELKESDVSFEADYKELLKFLQH
ncbi:MAG: chromosomal replication initiator protein DnaA [Acinetobacter sp.]|nr:chromosomal replication initiator protein DnaA [Acinetobacter sp.]